MESENVEQGEGIHNTAGSYRWGLFVLLALAIVGGLYWAYIALFVDAQREHFIQGVPYWGMYRGTEITTASAFVVYSILQYWGDDRFSTGDISELFPYIADPANATSFNEASQIVAFFEENGYSVSRIEKAQKISKMDEFIDNDIPLVISQKLSLDSPSFVRTTRILIGYSNKDRLLTLHDNLFGNNYELSYSDFKRLRKTSALVIEPGLALTAEIAGPNPDIPYPERLTIMDSPSMQRINTKWATIGALRSRYFRDDIPVSSNQIAELFEEIVAEDAFGDLHPAGRLIASYDLARVYTNNLGEHQKAVDVLTNVAMPLLSIDFSQPFGEWERLRPEIYDDPWWYTKPWVLLGLAHSRLGNTVEAGEAFRKALEGNPNDEEAQKFLEEL